MRKEIYQKLEALAEADYRDFHKKLIPTVSPAKIMGVRVPKIREIAKTLAKDGERLLAYIGELKGAEREDLMYEEVMLWGILIGQSKLPNSQKYELLRDFVPYIDNWAVCDSLSSGLKFIKKDLAGMLKFIEPYIEAGRGIGMGCTNARENEFSVRFAIVVLMDYYIVEDYIDMTLSTLYEIGESLKTGAEKERLAEDKDGSELTKAGSQKIYDTGYYYMQMAIAWAISFCYIKYPEKTLPYIKENNLDIFTHNKSIQKVRESYRISKEDKEYLNTLKR